MQVATTDNLDAAKPEIVTAPDGALAARVRELEMRLRHIGAEVRAAAMLDEFCDPCSPGNERQLSELGSHQPRISSERFSTRQREILVRVSRGERVKDIAAALYLSPSTVRNHLTAIYDKLGVHSQVELLVKLLNPDD